MCFFFLLSFFGVGGVATEAAANVGLEGTFLVPVKYE